MPAKPKTKQPAAAKAVRPVPRPAPAVVVSPEDLLLGYQRDWCGDESRFKIGCWARQTGKSFSTAEETVKDSLKRKTTWVALSAGERQALEWMRKAQEWAEAWKLAVAGIEEIRDSAEALLKRAEMEFANGSRIIALPANPDTARGYSANLLLDEFAFHERPDDIWRAIYPSISNPLRGTFKIRIVSTPNGLGNKFADLWKKAVRWTPDRPPLGKGQWSAHLVDIETAVRRGLPIDLEELRAGLDDPDGWAQEYECQFIDGAAVLLPYEIIAGMENANATTAVGPEYWRTRGGPPVDLGIDFGRKKNLTVCWALEDAHGYRLTREVLELANMSTVDQADILGIRIDRARRVALDYTGPGVGLGDLLVRKFGEWKPDAHKFGKVELCTFTPALKTEIFPKLRMIADRKMIGIPVSRVIREDLHSMQRTVSAQGRVTYAAPLIEDSHADRCTALALAVRAAEGLGGAFAYRRVKRPERGHRLV